MGIINKTQTRTCSGCYAEIKMFDINGGGQNVLTFLMWLISFGMFVIIPVLMALAGHEMKWYRKWQPVIAFIVGFALWFAMLYVSNPSLTLWK